MHRFVDRDMVMCYLGLGVGHLNSADFPGDSGLIRPDVLVEYDTMPWTLTDHGSPMVANPDPSVIDSESDIEDRLSIDDDDMYDL